MPCRSGTLKTDIPQGLYQHTCSPQGRLIRQVIRNQFADWVVISVVSRLGPIGQPDHVAVMGDGRLLELESEFERLRGGILNRLINSRARQSDPS